MQKPSSRLGLHAPLCAFAALLLAERTPAFVGDPPPAACFFEDAKLVASEALRREQLGSAVALEGNTLALGAPGWVGLSTTPGRAFVFERVGGEWVETAVLTASDGSALDGFGDALALSGDRLVVGAYGNDRLCPSDPHCNAGAAYVFLRTPGGWVQEARLSASDAKAVDFFGAAVAIDGDTIVIGASNNTTPGVHLGAAYVFTRTPQGWVQSSKLVADLPSIGRFGISIDLDGSSLAIGATGVGSAGLEAAYVFVHGPLGWVQQAHLISSDWQNDDEFGMVALDGDTLVVGACQDDGACPTTQVCQSGAAYVFERDGSVWTERAKLLATTPAGNDFFGISVGLENGVAVIAAPSLTSFGNKKGWAYVFRRDGSQWKFEQRLQGAGVEVADFFAWRIALSQGRILAGAVGDDDMGLAAGAGYVFQRIAPPERYCTAKTSSQGCLPAMRWTGSPSASQADDFHLTASEVNSGANGILLWSVHGAQAAPFGGGTLCVETPLVRSPLVDSGGAAPCGGSFDFFFSQGYMEQYQVLPGSQVHAQFWYRDAGFSPPDDIGLTDAVVFSVCR